MEMTEQDAKKKLLDYEQALDYLVILQLDYDAALHKVIPPQIWEEMVGVKMEFLPKISQAEKTIEEMREVTRQSFVMGQKIVGQNYELRSETRRSASVKDLDKLVSDLRLTDNPVAHEIANLISKAITTTYFGKIVRKE